MRIIRENRSRFLRCSSLPAALAGSAALLLSACQSEAPTSTVDDAPTNIPIRSFTLATGATDAAKGSTHRIIRTLGTLSNRNSPGATISGGDQVINSPFDLTYVGGQVVSSAKSWNVYVNCPTGPADCWGTNDLTPATFLHDLNRSPFIRVVNQYLGSDAFGQFRVDELGINGVPYPPGLGGAPTASFDDIASLLFSAATFTGASGYTNIYHVFLPQGTDMCLDVGFCYSPDFPPTWVFCAFHGSLDFADPNDPTSTFHVLFSVEPFQGVGGCAFQTPNGLIDATSSTLSHEFFETITDPDLDSWYNFLTGEEVADLCSAFSSNERFTRHFYSIQLEYSNRVHACTNRS